MPEGATCGDGAEPQTHRGSLRVVHSPTTFHVNIDVLNYDFSLDVHFGPAGEPDQAELRRVLGSLASNNLCVAERMQGVWDLNDPGHLNIPLDLIDLHAEVDEDWQP